MVQDIAEINSLIADISNVVGSVSKAPNNNACIALTKKAAEPAKTFALSPDGDIVLSAGGTVTVSLTGAAQPYIRPLFAQSVPDKAVAATLKQNSIELAAGSEVVPGLYPFFVGDGANGKVLDVMTFKKASVDNFGNSCP